MRKILLILFLGIFSSFSLYAQNGSISGKVKDSESGNFLEKVKVEILGVDFTVYTDANGKFLISDVPQGKYLIELSMKNYQTSAITVKVVANQTTNVKEVQLVPYNNIGQLSNFDISSLNNEELDDEGSTDNSISGLLAGSRDVFVSNAGYVFSQLRFRSRGYSSDNTAIRMNGLLMNDMENGRGYWYKWGGLNDVTRNKETVYGLGESSYGFGEVGGTTNINTIAANYRPGNKLVYSYSNKSYTNRVMATHSTGLMNDGWALTMSVSRRWGDEGYVDATFYDAYGYFLSVYKQLGEKHSLNLTAFGAPSKRGKGGASTQEVYDLVGSNYYNPYWGYQNGEKRNSRVSRSHQPIFMLNHKWKFNDKTQLNTAVSYTFGHNGSTRLSWFNAPDPRPDYYSKLPSNSYDKELLAGYWKNNTNNIRHIDWDRMYRINANSPNANYFVEENRYDAKQLMVSSILDKELNKHWKLTAGVDFTNYIGSRFNVMNDLLGAQYFIDYDKFAPASTRDNDLNRPDRKVYKGDRFGYDYDVHLQKYNAFAQADFSYKQWDGYIGAEVNYLKAWREGKMKKAVFAENSYGSSKKKDAGNYGVKAGLVYKLDGRNYFLVNGTYKTRAPFLRNCFESARTRNVWVQNLKNEQIMAFDAGYRLRTPLVKASVNGFYTRFADQTEVRNYFMDGTSQKGSAFVNAIMTGIDKEHFGVELGVEAQLTSTLTVVAAASKGQYIWDSRPNLKLVEENTGKVYAEEKVYAKNFYVAGTPQTAATLGLKYRSPKYWWAGINANYYDDAYLDFFAGRRTSSAVKDLGIQPDTKAWHGIIDQRKLDNAFTLDMNIGKSWKFNEYYITLNASVNNLLDSTDIITGGYEQSRTDYRGTRNFGDKLYYYYGRTYFINLSVRF